MMPFRGSYHSYPGNGRKNIPGAVPPSQPTAPSFNVPEALPGIPQEANTPPAAQPIQEQPSKMTPAAAPTAMPSTEKALQTGVPSPVMFTPPVMPSQKMNIESPMSPMMQGSPNMYMQPMYQNPMVQPSMVQPSMLQNPITQPVCPYMNSQMLFGAGDMNMMDMYEDTDATIRIPNTDPPPVLSNNPVVPSISFFKELTGYPNYGNPSGNADILYTGNRGIWTMDIAPFLLVPGNQRAQLIIRAVLDDHYNTPARQYSLRITVNGTVVHNGPVSLEHGTPSGSRFSNWQSLTFNIFNMRRNNRIVIENTSNTGPSDWIAFDWMELRLAQR